MATLTAIETKVNADVSWIQRHERILIVAMVLLAGSWLGNKYLSGRIQAAENKLAVATQQLADQQALNKQQLQASADAAKETQQATTIYQATIDTPSRQNAALASAVASRNVQLQQQHAVDANLTLPDLAVRWKNLSSLSDSEISASAAGVTLSDSGARKTVAQLEELPIVKANLVDETKTAENTQTELTSANGVIAKQGDQIVALNTQIGGLNQEIKKSDQQHKDAIALINDKQRKGKIKWFIGGVVSTIALLAHFGAL